MSNQESRSVAAFAHLADTCVMEGKLSGDEPLEKIEKEIAAHYGVDYRGTCSYLLEGIGHLNEFKVIEQPGASRLIAFSEQRSGPTIERDEAGKVIGDNERYVLYFDRNKKSFFGILFTRVSFEKELIDHGLKIEDGIPFAFPILTQQQLDSDKEREVALSSDREHHEKLRTQVNTAPPSNGDGSGDSTKRPQIEARPEGNSEPQSPSGNKIGVWSIVVLIVILCSTLLWKSSRSIKS